MITLRLQESDRQLVLLALAILALRSPGFDWALSEIAIQIDNDLYLYKQFKESNENHPFILGMHNA